MKSLTVPTSSLKNAMSTVKKVIVTKRCVLPIIEYFKCEVIIRDGIAKLIVTGTDLENQILATVDCEAKEEFVFLIHSDELKLIEKLDDQPITISVDEEKYIARIITNEETVIVTGDDCRDYPIIPTAQRMELGTLPSEFISEIKTCLNFVSSDDLRPAMTGINFKIENGKVELCATDAHLLRTTSLNCQVNPDAEGESFIMNRTLCKLISSIKNAEEMKISVVKKDNSKYTVFSYTQGRKIQVEIISKNIEANYCAYQSVIPSHHSTDMILNKKDLSNRINKAVLYANKTTFQGIFSINGKVILTTKDNDFHKEYRTEFHHNEKQGEDIDISFNLSLLMKVLTNLKGETVNFRFNKPNQAAVITELNTLILIMPCLM